MNRAIEKLSLIFEAVDIVLEEWSSTNTGNCKSLELLQIVASRLSWTAKESRVNLPLIKFYLANNDTWKLSSGRNGGVSKISKPSEQQEKLKQEVRDMIASKVKLTEKLQVEEDSDDFDFEKMIEDRE